MSSLLGHRRREFPQSVRKAALKRCTRDSKPHCETCDAELGERTGIIFEHVTPDGLGGEPTLENCKVHCKTCADVKTHTEDNPRMRKADRTIKARFGLKPTRVKIQSKPFAKAPPQRKASSPVEKWRGF
ncbi:HNH endonuclease [Bradyrhizobium sp. 2]|uniref:HNH endonuclease n=1 Tax=Bradyrhizobium sp. 2 TaxID=190045 RepID=UPI001FFAA5AD|nr:HNH endonuclease [Bradyrhizobium sp. 2]MCK1459128.1 HNH endonuclease [Bradyrhizobium sp. 2]MCK1459193.1 HNH endonuclease [Bradyrhizobium sp. 2]